MKEQCYTIDLLLKLSEFSAGALLPLVYKDLSPTDLQKVGLALLNSAKTAVNPAYSRLFDKTAAIYAKKKTQPYNLMTLITQGKLDAVATALCEKPWLLSFDYRPRLDKETVRDNPVALTKYLEREEFQFQQDTAAMMKKYFP